jgi:hypothetical protein
LQSQYDRLWLAWKENEIEWNICMPDYYKQKG